MLALPAIVGLSQRRRGDAWDVLFAHEQVAVGGDGVGLPYPHPLEMLLGFGCTPLQQQVIAETRVHLDIVGRQPQGLAVATFCLGRPSAVVQDDAEVVVRLGAVRPELNGAAGDDFGVGIPLQFEQRRDEVQMRQEMIRRARDGAPEVRLRLLGPGLQQQHPSQIG
jgi:hypothetical protein